MNNRIKLTDKIKINVTDNNTLVTKNKWPFGNVQRHFLICKLYFNC